MSDGKGREATGVCETEIFETKTAARRMRTRSAAPRRSAGVSN